MQNSAQPARSSRLIRFMVCTTADIKRIRIRARSRRELSSFPTRLCISSGLCGSTFINPGCKLRANVGKFPRRTQKRYFDTPWLKPRSASSTKCIARAHEYPGRFLCKTYIRRVPTRYLLAKFPAGILPEYDRARMYEYVRAHTRARISLARKRRRALVSTYRFYAGRHRQKGNRLQSNGNCSTPSS